MTFGEAVCIARKKKNLSQASLAKKVGMSPTTIVNIEQGKYNPQYSTVKNLSEELGLRYIEYGENFEEFELPATASGSVFFKGKQIPLNTLVPEDLLILSIILDKYL